MPRHHPVKKMPEGGEVQNAVFIMGEVIKPGAYPRAEALTLMKLVSMAGGFGKYASPSRVTLIREMGESKAIIFSTHILEEVEAACTRAIIIDRGRIVANGTPAELKARAPSGKLEDFFRSITRSDVQAEAIA